MQEWKPENLGSHHSVGGQTLVDLNTFHKVPPLNIIALKTRFLWAFTQIMPKPFQVASEFGVLG